MMGDYITFESVSDWDHLQLSGELFRKKHHNSVVEFKTEITSLIKDIHSYLSFVDDFTRRGAKSDEDKVTNNKKLFQQCKQEKSRIENDILTLESENQKLRISFNTMNDRLIELGREASELLELKRAFNAEVQATYNALLLAKGYYKDKLNLYFTIDGSPDADEITIVVEFFTTRKKRESQNSVTILKSKSVNKFKLLDMKPKLWIFQDLCRRLEDTNDASGLLCCVRKCFLNYHHSKK